MAENIDKRVVAALKFTHGSDERGVEMTAGRRLFLEATMFAWLARQKICARDQSVLERGRTQFRGSEAHQRSLTEIAGKEQHSLGDGGEVERQALAD